MAPLKRPHWEAVTPEMRSLLRFIGQQSFARHFYLAGGTALALRLGHRRSIDFDFFSEDDAIQGATRDTIKAALAPFGAETIEDVDGNLLLALPDLHVAFLSYGYPLVGACARLEGVAVASLVDVGLMKLDALISRGSRKDFYDLYFVAQNMPIADLLALARTKYPFARDFELMAVESMLLFENADRDREPDMLAEVSWADVKQYFTAEARRLGAAWFGV